MLDIKEKSTTANQALYDLIQGEFNVEEAKDIVNYMFDKKINFHERKSFSSEIRFGHPDEKSRARLAELEKDRQAVQKLLGQAKSKNNTVKIFASLHIELI